MRRTVVTSIASVGLAALVLTQMLGSSTTVFLWTKKIVFDDKEVAPVVRRVSSHVVEASSEDPSSEDASKQASPGEQHFHARATFDSVQNRRQREMAHLVAKYRILFHKARLNVSNPLEPMRYDVVKATGGLSKDKRIAAHLHCFDLTQFLDIYGAYLPLLQRYCDCIVTYCAISQSPSSSSSDVLDVVLRSLKPGDSLLKIPNKGMDVGAKFCAVHYLTNGDAFRSASTISEENAAAETAHVSARQTTRPPTTKTSDDSNINTNGNVVMVLFLHSKTDAKQRYRYYEWYLNQLPLIPSTVDDAVGGVFNPYLLVEQPGWPRNTWYMRELIEYFGLEETYFTFPEGNCFFLSYDMASALYNDSRIYQMLNTNTSVDLPWILEYYRPTRQTMKDLKTHIRQGKLAVNNLHLKQGHDGLADSMMEHAYERLPLLMLRRHGKYGVFDFAKVPVKRALDEYLTNDEDEDMDGRQRTTRSGNLLRGKSGRPPQTDANDQATRFSLSLKGRNGDAKMVVHNWTTVMQVAGLDGKGGVSPLMESKKVKKRRKSEAASDDVSSSENNKIKKSTSKPRSSHTRSPIANESGTELSKTRKRDSTFAAALQQEQQQQTKDRGDDKPDEVRIEEDLSPLPIQHGGSKYWQRYRLPLDDGDLRDKYFGKSRTKYDRVVVMATHGAAQLRLSAVLNNLFYFAQIAFNIVIVDSTNGASPSSSERTAAKHNVDNGDRSEDASRDEQVGVEQEGSPPRVIHSIVGALEESKYREFFIVNDELTDVQCRWYANNHLDLVEAFSSVDELRGHYKNHGAKEKRYVPYVVASLSIVKTANTPFLCHHKWLVALNRVLTNLGDYSDYILTNDSILVVRSLLPFVQTTFDENVEMSVLLASNEVKFHYPDFLRRYNRRGIEKIRRFYAQTIDATKKKIHDKEQEQQREDGEEKIARQRQDKKNDDKNVITYEYMVQNFEIASSALFADVAVYRAAEAQPINIHFAFPYVKTWITQRGYEVVKLKFLRARRFDYPADFPEPQRPLRRGQLPRDFEATEYAKLNPDLTHLDTSALENHFLNNGIHEGRIYTRSQAKQVAGFLRPLIRTDGRGRVFTYNMPLPPRKLSQLSIPR